jgi:hypothetical protein
MTSIQTPPTPSAQNLIVVSAGDYTPLPAKSLHFRGVELTRSTLIRAIKAGKIHSRLLRHPGSRKGRRYILTESLAAYLAAHMEDTPILKIETRATGGQAA